MAKNIKDFMAMIKRGSNKFHSKISGRGSSTYSNFECSQTKPVKTLWEQMEIEVEEELLSSSFTLWKFQFLDLNFREFLFKMSQGLVHGNTVISHFGNVDRKCTFCKIVKVCEAKNRLGMDLTPAEHENEISTVPDEDRPHIFWACPTVFDTIAHVLNKLWGQNVPDKKAFLMGKLGQRMELTLIF
jgi:hypothetical protein